MTSGQFERRGRGANAREGGGYRLVLGGCRRHDRDYTTIRKRYRMNDVKGEV